MRSALGIRSGTTPCSPVSRSHQSQYLPDKHDPQDQSLHPDFQLSLEATEHLHDFS